MKLHNLYVLLCLLFFFTACKKEAVVDGQVVDAIYITSTAVTGTGANASTTITNSATGKVSVTPATARVYVNTPKAADVTASYTLGGTAISGSNYTPPNELTVTIPAGKWYADIIIPVINSPLVGNKTIVITLATVTNNMQVGLGTDRNYKTFTYTLTN
jgi:hypothetical protein